MFINHAVSNKNLYPRLFINLNIYNKEILY